MTDPPPIPATRPQAAGLPASAAAVMFGIVVVANTDRFGPEVAAMGAALAVAGLFFGVRLFRGRGPRAAADPTADTRKQDGENDT